MEARVFSGWIEFPEEEKAEARGKTGNRRGLEGTPTGKREEMMDRRITPAGKSLEKDFSARSHLL